LDVAQILAQAERCSQKPPLEPHHQRKWSEGDGPCASLDSSHRGICIRLSTIAFQVFSVLSYTTRDHCCMTRSYSKMSPKVLCVGCLLLILSYLCKACIINHIVESVLILDMEPLVFQGLPPPSFLRLQCFGYKISRTDCAKPFSNSFVSTTFCLHMHLRSDCSTTCTFHAAFWSFKHPSRSCGICYDFDSSTHKAQDAVSAQQTDQWSQRYRAHSTSTLLTSDSRESGLPCRFVHSARSWQFCCWWNGSSVVMVVKFR